MSPINPIEIDSLELFLRDLYRKEIKDPNLSNWTADVEKEILRCSDAFRELSVHPEASERLKSFTKMVSALIFLRINKIILLNPKHISNADKLFMEAWESTVLTSILKVDPISMTVLQRGNPVEAELHTVMEPPINPSKPAIQVPPPEPSKMKHKDVMLVRVIQEIDPNKPLTIALNNPLEPLPNAGIDYVLRTNDILTVPISHAKIFIDRKICVPVDVDLEAI